MNKLLVSDIIDIKDGEYELKPQSSQIEINVLGNAKIYIVNELVEEIIINLCDHSHLLFYYVQENFQNEVVININSQNKTKLELQATLINNCNSTLNIKNDITGNDNESNIKLRAISNKNNFKGIIDVNIHKNTLNNIALEDLKGINNGGMVHIEPNIICLSNEVVANHLTTIGALYENMLSYLKTATRNILASL